MLTFLEYRRNNRNLRLGQALCNFFKITDATLFYMRDEDEAWGYFMEHYPEYMLE